MSKDEDVTKSNSFFVGSASLFLDKQYRDMMNGRLKLQDFVDLFDDEDDKYYAVMLFEEKFPLVIKRATKDDHVISGMVYKKSKVVYNLFVRDDPDFYVERLCELEYLKEICNFFGFDYEIYQT